MSFAIVPRTPLGFGLGCDVFIPIGCHPFKLQGFALCCCDLSKFTSEDIKEIEYKLRNKYMKCLDYKTPCEVWDIEMQKWKKNQQIGIMKKKKHANISVLKVNKSVRLQGYV